MISDRRKQRATEPYRLGVLTATWGRPTLTEHVMRHFAALTVPGIEIVPLAVWSGEDPSPTPKVEGWRYVEVPNRPLGRKWNYGVRALMNLDVDAVMIVGSDDLVSWSYFEIVRDQLKLGADIISIRDLFIYHPPEDFVLYCESMIPGAGRVVTRKTIETVKGKLWDDDAQIYLDASIMTRLRQTDLRRHNARDMRGRGFAILDVKMREGPNIWRVVRDAEHNTTYLENAAGARLRIRRVTNIPAKQFFKDYFPHIKKYKDLGSGEPYGA